MDKINNICVYNKGISCGEPKEDKTEDRSCCICREHPWNKKWGGPFYLTPFYPGVCSVNSADKELSSEEKRTELSNYNAYMNGPNG